MTKTSGSTERDTYILQQKLSSVTSDKYKSVCNLEYNYEMKSHGVNECCQHHGLDMIKNQLLDRRDYWF